MTLFFFDLGTREFRSMKSEWRGRATSRGKLFF